MRVDEIDKIDKIYIIDILAGKQVCVPKGEEMSSHQRASVAAKASAKVLNDPRADKAAKASAKVLKVPLASKAGVFSSKVLKDPRAAKASVKASVKVLKDPRASQGPSQYNLKVLKDRAALLTNPKRTTQKVLKDPRASEAQRVAASQLAAQERALQKLRAASIVEDAFAPDARARAILVGREIALQDIKQAGGAFTLQEVMKLLGDVSRQRVDQLVKSGRLIAIPGPNNVRCYPTIQFNLDGTLVAGLDLVQSALPTNNPWVVLNFLAHRDPRLTNRSPIEVLRAGDVLAVVAAAKMHSEPGV